MLKKAITFSFIMLLMLLLYQVGVNYIKINHSITYTIKKDHVYTIKEDYQKNDDLDHYFLKITRNDDKVFLFDIDNVFNKQEEIVSDILEYSKDDFECITLIYKSKGGYSEPLCSKDGVVYSYQAAKDLVDLSEYTSKIKKFELDKFGDKSKIEVTNNINYNVDYFEDNEVLVMYDYKVVNYIDKKFSRSMSFSNVDNYKNTLGTIVGKYYMMPRFSTSTSFNTYIKFNLEEGIKNEIHMTYRISKQAYINGVHDKKLYVFDPIENKQYEIDPYTDEAKIVGDENNDGIIYVNGKKKSISVYDLQKEQVKFSEDEERFKNIDYDRIYIGEMKTIYQKDGSFYKIYNDYPEYPIYLFTDKDAERVIVRNENVYYLKDDSIYRYDKYGNVLLAQKNELKYNKDNTFDIYLK